jgi:hypothetical protein
MRIRLKLRQRLGGALVAAALVLAGLVATPAPASALGTGTMCIFNAPGGATGLGHVGWALREGPSTHWFYGSTEHGDGKPSSTWQLDGSQDAMFTAFRDRLVVGGVFMHAAGYYARWRCHETPTSAVGGALTKAAQMKNNGYNGGTNNCLTKSVAILSVYYGGDNLQSGVGWAPNDYFLRHLPGRQWGPSHDLQPDTSQSAEC